MRAKLKGHGDGLQGPLTSFPCLLVSAALETTLFGHLRAASTVSLIRFRRDETRCKDECSVYDELRHHPHYKHQGEKLASQSLQGSTSTIVLDTTSADRSTQSHRCTITLFVNPAASIVKLSSSSVRFGNVVPIVYARVLFSGRELTCNIIQSNSTRWKNRQHSRVDETTKIAHSMVQIYPSHDPTNAMSQHAIHSATQRSKRT